MHLWSNHPCLHAMPRLCLRACSKHLPAILLEHAYWTSPPKQVGSAG